MFKNKRVKKKILLMILSFVMVISNLLLTTNSFAEITSSSWYQNFEAGTGFVAGTGSSVSSDASSANTGGTKSIKMTFGTSGDPGTTSNCVKVSPQNGSSVDATGKNYLVFSANDTQGANTIRVTIVDTSNALWSGWTSNKSVKNQWTKIALPLSGVTGINKSAIKEIRIGEWNAGTYYFDDIYLATNSTDTNPSFASIPDSSTIPGLIEAEKYTSMNGVATETCTEGGSNVGWIEAGDWMDYNVNVPVAGTYTLEFRVSGQNPTGSLQLQKNGAVIGIVTPPNTNGWQNWTTVSTKVTLSAGVQSLRVYSTGNSINLNWINFTTSANTKPTVVGYIPNWSFDCYKTVDLNILTHICIAFAEPDSSGNLSLGLSDTDINACIARAHGANVKVLISLGGGEGNPNYTKLLQSQNRSTFCDKIQQYVNKYNLDGVDVDLEINSNNNLDSNWEPFINDLYSRLKSQGKTLTAAVADWEGDLLPATAFNKLDLVNVMSYGDYQTAVNSLNYFVNNKGIDKKKLILGVAFFGYTSDGSYIGYKDIIAKYPDAWNVDSYAGINYVGAASMAKQTLLGKGYGGIMIWDMSLDGAGNRSLLKVIGDNIK